MLMVHSVRDSVPRGSLNMPPLLIVTLTVLACCVSVRVPSFWAPLFDRRILNYRVDAAFDPDVAKTAREHYATHYGYRGERLVAGLGNGEAPRDVPRDHKMYGAVMFTYT